MAKPKVKYQVYSSYEFLSDDYEDCHRDKWTYEGETWAVSEKQAINNIRHRNYGNDFSQYGPMDTGNRYCNRLYFKAIAHPEPLPPESLGDPSWSNNPYDQEKRH